MRIADLRKNLEPIEVIFSFNYLRRIFILTKLLQVFPQSLLQFYFSFLADYSHFKSSVFCYYIYSSQSWMLSRNEINKFSADEALSLFDKLSRETDQFVS